MTIYDEEDIQYGAGSFEQTMRAQSSIPGRGGRLTPGAAVGILSAGMRSGLPADLLTQAIEQHYGDNVTLLKRILAMYEGNDWSINLWNLLPSGQYKLCTDLCRPGLPRWRYAPFSD